MGNLQWRISHIVSDVQHLIRQNVPIYNSDLGCFSQVFRVPKFLGQVVPARHGPVAVRAIRGVEHYEPVGLGSGRNRDIIFGLLVVRPNKASSGLEVCVCQLDYSLIDSEVHCYREADEY